MKVGLFGGSFDPIHRGHLEPVRTAREALGLERVLYLPTGRPPHKPGRELAPAHARYTMVELALLGEEGFFASPYELREDRPSYTIETLECFHRLLPQAELFLLIGSDSLAELETWRRWREIPELAELAVLTRPHWRLADVVSRLPSELAEQVAAGRIHEVHNPPLAVSATEIRRRLAAGEEIPAGDLPELVLDYVVKYGLYRDNPGRSVLAIS